MPTNLDNYFARREQLITEDREQRIDANVLSFRPKEIEMRADQVVRDIRAQEALDVWGSDSNLKLDVDTHLFPGMAFLTCALHFI